MSVVEATVEAGAAIGAGLGIVFLSSSGFPFITAAALGAPLGLIAGWLLMMGLWLTIGMIWDICDALGFGGGERPPKP